MTEVLFAFALALVTEGGMRLAHALERPAWAARYRDLFLFTACGTLMLCLKQLVEAP